MTTSVTPVKRGSSLPTKQKSKAQRPGTMKKSETRKGALGQMSNPINPFQKADSVLSIDKDMLMSRIE